MAFNDIDDSFVKQFESEVHLAYQRMGSKLTNMTRKRMGIVGSSTTFQKTGSGTAGVKGRNGQVPIMNFTHTPVECTLADYYAGQYIDKLDTLKQYHDEMQIATTNAAAALGRKSDELVTTVLDAQSTNQTATASGITQAKVEEIFEYFGNNDVDDDGKRFGCVSPQGWTDLANITGFSSRDFVPEAELPYRGTFMTAKRWHTIFWFMFSGLSKSAGVRSSHVWHWKCIGFGSGQEIYMDITWQGKEQANLAVGGMSQGAVVIDTTGVYKLRHTEV